MEDPNETAKFYMDENLKKIMEKEKKEEMDKFVNNIEKCPICKEVILNKKFLDHVGDKHMGNNLNTAITLLEGKVRELGIQCSQIYLVHYWLLLMSNEYQPSQAQKDKYVKIREKASKYYSSSFSDKEL